MRRDSFVPAYKRRRIEREATARLELAVVQLVDVQRKLEVRRKADASPLVVRLSAEPEAS